MLLPPLSPARTEEREDCILDDLNDYHCFVQVVAQCGFAAASRVLGIPKSKLSRRVAALEQRLGADRHLGSAVHAGPRWVQTRPYGETRNSSASPPKADLHRLRQFGWKVPGADIISRDDPKLQCLRRYVLLTASQVERTRFNGNAKINSKSDPKSLQCDKCTQE